MSPEPDAEQINADNFERAQEEMETDTLENANNIQTSTVASEICYQTECSLPRKQRERRNKSPIAISTLLETFAAPLSPASSSCTSLGNSSADATFEPSVDMMVNDFDDEQTLNEEEALAAMEQQDPHDEISTLREESEMPLEELLAKYQVLPPAVPLHVGSSRKKNKKTSGGSKHSKHRKMYAGMTSNVDNIAVLSVGAMESVEGSKEKCKSVNEIDTLDEDIDGEEHGANVLVPDVYDDENEESIQEFEVDNNVARQIIDKRELELEHVEKKKSRRTHLMDLYPEESFTEVLNTGGGEEKDIYHANVYNEGDDVEDVNELEEDGEDDFDSYYVKKTIMVGPSYQATIPDGLSQYGDVLPYENEDKLIWEPSQVSEREVEEYLLKARDIKPSLLDNADEDGEESSQANTAQDATVDPTILTPNGNQIEYKEIDAKQTHDSQCAGASASGENGDAPAVIKDNEQALHLLVQCGYDFKEALRRKRLNALPLTGSMSLWSEEECHKFEEGIQKFGKDFLKIRQNQVRTRTMRELVQFYYIWKKSDRRDHNFANSDTVDHMDIYLNEGGDYSPTTTLNGVTATGSANSNCTITLGVRKNCAQKNSISIMMNGGITNASTSSTAVTTTTTATPTPTPTPTVSSQFNTTMNTVVNNNRKRSVVGNSYENPVTQSIPLSGVQMK